MEARFIFHGLIGSCHPVTSMTSTRLRDELDPDTGPNLPIYVSQPTRLRAGSLLARHVEIRVKTRRELRLLVPLRQVSGRTILETDPFTCCAPGETYPSACSHPRAG